MITKHYLSKAVVGSFLLLQAFVAAPALAQYSSSIEMSQFSIEVSDSWIDKCARFVELPQNRSESHNYKPSFLRENHTTTGMAAGMNCQVIFNIGYKSLLSDRGQAISFKKGRTAAETRKNAYDSLEAYLLDESEFIFRMRRLARRKDLRKDIGLTLVSSVMHSVIQTYAYENFGIPPAGKK